MPCTKSLLYQFIADFWTNKGVGAEAVNLRQVRTYSGFTISIRLLHLGVFFGVAFTGDKGGHHNAAEPAKHREGRDANDLYVRSSCSTLDKLYEGTSIDRSHLHSHPSPRNLITTFHSSRLTALPLSFLKHRNSFRLPSLNRFSTTLISSNSCCSC